MTEDVKLMADVKDIFLKVMQQNVTLMAVLDEPADHPRMIGLSILAVHSRSDDIVTRLEGPAAEKFERLLDALREGLDIFDELDLDVHLEDYGVCVVPEYRGQQVAINMILSVKDLAIEFGIRGKTVTLSNFNLLTVAQKEGLRVLREIVYDDFRDANGEVIVPVKEFKSIAFCGLKFW